MTEPTAPTATPRATATGGGAPGGAAPAEKHYSKDYWDIVFHQLSRHRLFKVGMAVLALMYGVSIYAPFLANDRPFSLTGVDLEEYGSALRVLRPVAMSVGDLVVTDEATFAANRGPQSPPTVAAALDVERGTAAARLALLRTYLPDGAEGPLDAYEAALDRALEGFRAGDGEAAAAAAEEAKDLARGLRTELRARTPPAFDADPTEGESEDAEGVLLEPVTSYPLWTNVAAWEVFLMVLWAFVLTWPLWNRLTNRVVLGGDRERIRSWRRVKLYAVLGASLLAAGGWWFATGGQRDTFDASPIKARLTSGAFVATERPVFPPLAFGYSETHTEENFRPPTWTSAGKRDAEGRPLGWTPPEDGAPVPPATPVEVRFAEPEANSPWRHPAGTDGLGRDFLVRMIWGGRVSLAVGILSSVLLTVIGVVIGSVAGYFGGRVDVVIMRLIEIIQSIPAFFLILATLSFTDPEVIPPIFAIVVVIALIRWTGVARLVRGEFLRLREQEFVVAARALGFGSARTIFKHVLPNALSPVLVAAAFAVASGILTESAVSYLGFGVQAPKASWGSLVNESRDSSHWWVQVFPGLLIFVTVTCYNLVGDAIRDALDPKMKV